MSNGTAEQLYDLLPAVYRVRDAERGEPLRAMLGVIERELDALERDVDGLYDDWFIETCAEWVIPYIGDLLGVRPLHPGSAETFSLRAYVANTLAYRRRKGTAAVLEQLAHDVSGWPSRVVELFMRLGTTQHINHLRPGHFGTPDLRDTEALERIGGAFDVTNRTGEVRHIRSGRGRYNIPHVGLFLFRTAAYPIEHGTPRLDHEDADAWYYTFDPLGWDVEVDALGEQRSRLRLFNQPRTEPEISHLAGEEHVPVPLRRRLLYDELEARRQALVDQQQPSETYFGDPAALQLFWNGTDPVAPEAVAICNLATWRLPPAVKTYEPADGDPPEVAMPIVAAVDPAFGRLVVPKAGNEQVESVEVSYAYGYAGDLGAGPYPRHASVEAWLQPDVRPVSWQIGVTRDPDALASQPFPPELTPSLADAIAGWHAHVAAHPQAFGVIVLMDSRTYAASDPQGFVIEVPAGARLAVVAGDWPSLADPDSPAGESRPLGGLAPQGARPHLLGNVRVQGTGAAGALEPGELVLDGLLIEHSLQVAPGHLGRLEVRHCTLAADAAPDAGRITALSQDADGQRNRELRVDVVRTRCTTISLAPDVPRLHVRDSLVDGRAGPDGSGTGAAIVAEGAAAEVLASTLLGTTAVRQIEASDSLFESPVTVVRAQVGCVRYSLVAPGSIVPRRYRCQPALALHARAQELGLAGPDDLPVDERQAIEARLRPHFTSLSIGHHAYLSLSASCPAEIRLGAEGGGEQGGFNFLERPHRRTNIHVTLDEYLPFGLEAGTIANDEGRVE